MYIYICTYIYLFSGSLLIDLGLLCGCVLWHSFVALGQLCRSLEMHRGLFGLWRVSFDLYVCVCVCVLYRSLVWVSCGAGAAV